MDKPGFKSQPPSYQTHRSNPKRKLLNRRRLRSILGRTADLFGGPGWLEERQRESEGPLPHRASERHRPWEGGRT